MSSGTPNPCLLPFPSDPAPSGLPLHCRPLSTASQGLGQPLPCLISWVAFCAEEAAWKARERTEFPPNLELGRSLARGEERPEAQPAPCRGEPAAQTPACRPQMADMAHLRLPSTSVEFVTQPQKAARHTPWALCQRPPPRAFSAVTTNF